MSIPFNHQALEFQILQLEPPLCPRYNLKQKIVKTSRLLEWCICTFEL